MLNLQPYTIPERALFMAAVCDSVQGVPEVLIQVCIACVRQGLCALCRREKSLTNRHLCEFTGLDFEMAIDWHYSEVLDVMDRLFVHMFSSLQSNCGLPPRITVHFPCVSHEPQGDGQPLQGSLADSCGPDCAPPLIACRQLCAGICKLSVVHMMQRKSWHSLQSNSLWNHYNSYRRRCGYHSKKVSRCWKKLALRWVRIIMCWGLSDGHLSFMRVGNRCQQARRLPYLIRIARSLAEHIWMAENRFPCLCSLTLLQT